MVLRSKELQKLIESTSSIMQEDHQKLDDVCQRICDDIPVFADTYRVNIGEHVLKDLDIVPWLTQFVVSDGGKRFMRDGIVGIPLHDATLLNDRAHVATTVVKPSTMKNFANIKKNEPTILWALSVDDAKPFHLLFPSWPLLKYLNTIPLFVMALYVFRGYVSPLLNVLYPITSVVGPYFYMNRYLKFRISFMQYINILKMALRVMLRPGPGLRANATKYVSIIVYVVFLLYGVIQGFDLAHVIRKMRINIAEKMEKIVSFVSTARTIIDSIPDFAFEAFSPGLSSINTVSAFDLKNDMTSFYRLLTDSNVREDLRTLLQKVYVADAICGVHRMSKVRGFSRCNYRESTALWGMGHPLLMKRKSPQVRNPLSLQRNIIITGPNAAGKTTYMKAVCANIVLAQSVGFVCAVRNEIQPVHAISTSIRVHDTVGESSLFEAEVKRCAEIVKEAQAISASGRLAMYFLDEPMHSTPPTEGAATAMSIAAHMGSLAGIKLFMTTHYHQVTQLEKMYPDAWMNVSMEAIAQPDGGFVFPYKIRKGPSFQCIALEILKDRALPEEIIDNAIEMKNKICQGLLDSNAP